MVWGSLPGQEEGRSAIDGVWLNATGIVHIHAEPQLDKVLASVSRLAAALVGTVRQRLRRSEKHSVRPDRDGTQTPKLQAGVDDNTDVSREF